MACTHCLAWRCRLGRQRDRGWGRGWGERGRGAAADFTGNAQEAERGEAGATAREAAKECCAPILVCNGETWDGVAWMGTWCAPESSRRCGQRRRGSPMDGGGTGRRGAGRGEGGQGRAGRGGAGRGLAWRGENGNRGQAGPEKRSVGGTECTGEDPFLRVS